MINFALPGSDRLPINSILTLKIQSLTAGSNAEGNAIFTEQIIKAECYLRLDRRFYKNETLERVPGSDRTDIKVAGFTVNPQVLPPEIKPGIEVECRLNIGNTCLDGFLEIEAYVQNPLMQELGIQDLNRIKGTFRQGRKQL
jgi:hypothetical protein